MAWAAGGGLLAATYTQRALVEGWSSDIGQQWQAAYQQILGRRHRQCAMVAALLRRPWLLQAVVRMLGLYPGLSDRFTRSLNRPMLQGAV